MLGLALLLDLAFLTDLLFLTIRVLRFIKPGTTIISDCWKAYNGIDGMGMNYVHHAVNHSKEFVDAAGNHTNNMEASWRTIKMKVPSRKRNHNILQEHLFEVMWRNQNVGDIWQCLLGALKEIHYGPEE
jgi:hypothetical protein